MKKDTVDELLEMSKDVKVTKRGRKVKPKLVPESNLGTVTDIGQGEPVGLYIAEPVFKRGDKVVVVNEDGSGMVFSFGKVITYNPNSNKYYVNGICRMKNSRGMTESILPMSKTFFAHELKLAEEKGTNERGF